MTLTELGLQEFIGEETEDGPPSITRHYNTKQSTLIRYKTCESWHFYLNDYKGIFFIGIFKSVKNNYFLYLRAKGRSTEWICPFFYNHQDIKWCYFYGEDYNKAQDSFNEFLKQFWAEQENTYMEV